MSNRFAPPGKVWLCLACGKRAHDYVGDVGPRDRGWDESCALNCRLADDPSGQYQPQALRPLTPEKP